MPSYHCLFYATALSLLASGIADAALDGVELVEFKFLHRLRRNAIFKRQQPLTFRPIQGHSEYAYANIYVPFESKTAFRTITSTTHGNVTEVSFVILNGLTANESYTWTIHESPVIRPGDCASAGPIWDSNGAGLNSSSYSPIAGNLSSYAAGDLSGKFGLLNTTNATVTANSSSNVSVPRVTFLDPTIHDLSQNIGRGFVIGYPNGTTLGCANVTSATVFTWAEARGLSLNFTLGWRV